MTKDALGRFLILEGVVGAMVIGNRGDLIESVKSGLSSPENVATALSFVMAESNTVANRFGRGALNVIVIEFDEYILIAGPLTPESFLAVVARTSSNIGQISIEMRKMREQISQ